MNELAKDAVPRVNYRVRRRHYGDSRWLVYRNDWYVIDELSDTVWLACQEGYTIEKITHEVAARHQYPLGEALAAVVGLILHLRSLGLVSIDPKV
jgi:hypothetical protein